MERTPDESGEMPLMVDRFVIEDELGSGGMGRVYVAYDPTLDRRVAVKLLRDRLHMDLDRAHERMAREARAMAKLRHPNVVTVHEVGTDRGGVYIVMEYVAGATLRGWRERTPDADWRQVIAMYALAGRGLVAAHDAGLVHRDFKPDNVLVGDDGRVLVGDFGIANIEPSRDPTDDTPTPARLTRHGALLGTPPYMAPEQHRGEPVDTRTDQFAFCAALYEALYGTPPFAGETSTEIAERAIRGELTPPAREPGVPSRIHAAILRGLRADPAERFPSMAALLAELAVERRSRVRWIALAAGAAAIAAFAFWFVMRDDGAKPSPSGLVAVESFDIAMISYGNRLEWREGVGDVIAILLADIDGFKAIGPTQLLGADGVRDAREFRAAEAKVGAHYVVRGSIEERRDRVHARVTLIQGTNELTTFELDRPTTELAKLLEDVTSRIAHEIAPGRALDHSHATVRAQALFAIGDDYLKNNDFQMAWVFLEQAVVADPKYFDAWYALALTRSWVLAPESLVFAAIDQARSLAPTELKRTLVDAEGRFVHNDLPGARALLEPIIDNPKLSKREQRDALYFLGEAYWHDGNHRAGVGYFRRALDIDMKFKPPVQHLGEYATANRDLAMMNQYAAMIASSTSDYRDRGRFMRGEYEEVARGGVLPMRLYAKLVLGHTPTPDDESQLTGAPIDTGIYRAARALGADDRVAARAAIDEIWTHVRARQQAGELADNTYYLLRLLGDVVLSAELADEARRLVEFLAERSRDHPVRGYQRLSILAAPIVGDRTWIVRRNLSDRDRQLADAIEAEMSGDRARAVRLLDAIVRDPSPYWEYPERVALLRNLRALHRDKAAQALCEDTLRPAIFHYAYLPTRRVCAGR